MALTATAAITRRDAITVQNDITQKIGPRTETLLNDVNGFPASGLGGAIAIDNDIHVLAATVNDATNDVKGSGSFSEADGTAILRDIQDQESTVLDTLEAIRGQEPDWANLQGGRALMLSDLQELNTSFMGFISSLTAASPEDLVPPYTSIDEQIADAFNNAIAAYS